MNRLIIFAANARILITIILLFYFSIFSKSSNEDKKEVFIFDIKIPVLWNWLLFFELVMPLFPFFFIYFY